MSGIAAAHRLVKGGFQQVRILEATGRSGGRTLTSRLGERLHVSSFIHGYEVAKVHQLSTSGPVLGRHI